MKRFMVNTAALAALVLTLTACGSAQPKETKETAEPAQKQESSLKGTIKIDGSSTVGPISIAVAEEFRKLNKNVEVPVGISGSSTGIAKLVKGEIDIADSSRKIKDSEIADAKKNGIEVTELPVAYDGITVVVNKENSFLTCITKDELKKIWSKDSTVKKWNEVNPAWPAEEIKLYGPGTASGTFEFFTEHINGKAKESRADYTASEDDNVLVQGVVGNKNALGYFGYGYYVENSAKMKAVAIDGGKGCVAPSDKTIADQSYPLSRLIYIYPSNKAMERPEVKEFLKFYMQNGAQLSHQVGYTPLTAKMYEENLAKIK
jgi:phosphate transport system substrate-binding protein